MFDSIKPIPEKVAEVLAGSAGVRKELAGQTERGAAVLGAAYLDGIMKALLESSFIKGATTKELLNDSGPLGSFAARAKLLYCIGYIPKHIYNDLIRLAEIRNQFAHKRMRCTFDALPSDMSCENLEVPKNAEWFLPSKNNRERFQIAVSLIASWLELVSRKITRFEVIEL